MTYLEFHLFFNLPLIAVLLWTGRKRLQRVHLRWIGIICLIVLAFTIPWDNWAVGEKIWEFDEGRVLVRVLNLPIEEILFFVIETMVVCLVAVHFLPKPPIPNMMPEEAGGSSRSDPG